MVKYQHLMVGYLVLVVLTLIPPQLFYVLTSQSYVKKVSQVEDRGEQLAHNIQKLTIKQYIMIISTYISHVQMSQVEGRVQGEQLHCV